MSEVDLSKLKAGDTVHFRCGGSAVVECYDREQRLTFSNKHVSKYYNTGQFNGYCQDNHPFDIIRIEPAPFNWDDVKPGMAFVCTEDRDTLWYLMDAPKFIIEGEYEGEGFIIATDKLYADCPGSRLRIRAKSVLRRAPEHDVEVG